MSKQETAVELVRRGWAVIPTDDRKVPVNEGGSRGALTTEEDVRAFWRGRPEANPAVTPPPGVFIVDLDRKGDEDGQRTLQELQADHGELPSGVQATTTTPSGGAHIFVRAADGQKVPNSARKLGAGVDVRGDGGYVLVPGADGYEGELPPAPSELPEAPDWLTANARAGAVERDDHAHEWLVEPDQPADVKRAKDYLEREIEVGNVAHEGSRNDHLYRTAALMRDFGLTAERALELFHETGWAEHCVPGLPEDELDFTARNPYRYPLRPAGNRSALGAQDAFADIPAAESGEGAAAPRKRRLRLMGVTEAINMPAPTMLVDGTVPVGGIGQLYGAPGSYKSFIAVDMALSVACGRPWQGMETREGRVLYMAGEGVHGLGQRVNAWLSATGADPGQNFQLLTNIPDFGDHNPEGLLAELRELLEEWPPDLIVMDTQVHAMGQLDENDTKDASQFMRTVEAIQKLTGAAVMMVHHPDKSGKAARGSTVITAGLDYALYAEREEGQHTTQVRMTKAKDFPEWSRPVTFKSREEAGSLVLETQGGQPASPAAQGEDAMTKQLRARQEMAKAETFDALREVLVGNREAHPEGVMGLTEASHFVARRLETSRNVVRDRLRVSVKSYPEDLQKLVVDTTEHKRSVLPQSFRLPHADEVDMPESVDDLL